MTHQLTKRDQNYITKAIDLAADHKSGGSYDMVAIWVKGSRSIVGTNSLIRPARSENTIYPDICGFHAELDLIRQMGDQLKGGTIYIGGRKKSNNAIMMNTKPCVYCATLLKASRTNWVVYIQDCEFIKAKIESLRYRTPSANLSRFSESRY